MNVYKHFDAQRRMSRNSAVAIMTGYGLDGRRGRSLSTNTGKIVLLSTSSIPVLGFTQPPIQWVPRDLYPGVKRPGREADHSPSTIVEGQEYADLYIDSPYWTGVLIITVNYWIRPRSSRTHTVCRMQIHVPPFVLLLQETPHRV
jgi:hypothetical protein